MDNYIKHNIKISKCKSNIWKEFNINNLILNKNATLQVRISGIATETFTLIFDGWGYTISFNPTDGKVNLLYNIYISGNIRGTIKIDSISKVNINIYFTVSHTQNNIIASITLNNSCKFNNYMINSNYINLNGYKIGLYTNKKYKIHISTGIFLMENFYLMLPGFNIKTQVINNKTINLTLQNVQDVMLFSDFYFSINENFNVTLTFYLESFFLKIGNNLTSPLLVSEILTITNFNINSGETRTLIFNRSNESTGLFSTIPAALFLGGGYYKLYFSGVNLCSKNSSCESFEVILYTRQTLSNANERGKYFEYIFDNYKEDNNNLLIDHKNQNQTGLWMVLHNPCDTALMIDEITLEFNEIAGAGGPAKIENVNGYGSLYLYGRNFIFNISEVTISFVTYYAPSGSINLIETIIWPTRDENNNFIGFYLKKNCIFSINYVLLDVRVTFEWNYYRNGSKSDYFNNSKSFSFDAGDTVWFNGHSPSGKLNLEGKLIFNLDIIIEE